jgi:hypothetical protein
MTWPPVIPPNTRNNSTVSDTNHPTDHNQVSDALTAIVARVETLGGVSQVEVDMGALPVEEATFLVPDLSVTPTSKIVGSVAAVASTGKDLDEPSMDAIDVKCGPGNEEFTLTVRGLEGPLHGTFVINYIVG